MTSDYLENSNFEMEAASSISTSAVANKKKKNHIKTKEIKIKESNGGGSTIRGNTEPLTPKTLESHPTQNTLLYSTQPVL